MSEKKVPTYFIVSLTFIAGFASGIGAAVYVERPHTVYEKKIEGDERQFLITESKGRMRLPFVRTNKEDPYRRLSNVLEESETEVIESRKEYSEGLRRKLLDE